MHRPNIRFNPPPGWPEPPSGWTPPPGWTPEPSWPKPPEGWQLWLSDDLEVAQAESMETLETPNPTSLAPTFSGENPGDDARIAFLEAENAHLREQLKLATTEVAVDLDDARVLQDVGIYHYHHPLESAAAYKDRLKGLNAKIRLLIKSDRAIVKSERFIFNNSLAQGRKLSSDLGRLMLRAYNAEADIAIRTLRAGNVVTAKGRLESSRAKIAKLGRLMEMRIDDNYHKLRIEEIELTADWLFKKEQDRLLAREERARFREEMRVQEELEEERSRLSKERAHLTNTLHSLDALGQTDDELINRLAQIDYAIEQNDFRAANIRAGYIYVISNEGAFGPGVVKIGLTRRLKPSDRIAELSSASVPFRFDVHTIFFSEDAVSLENELHKHFSSRSVNQANLRKEFFFVEPTEVRSVLLSKVGNILEFTEKADAVEFRQSISSWPEGALRRSSVGTTSDHN